MAEMIKEWLASGMTEEEVVDELMVQLQEDRITARFIMEIELGRVHGDVYIRGRDGKIRPKRPGVQVIAD